MKPPANNHHEFREGWLRAATAELGPYFASVGYPLPDDIRFAIAFTSTGRKGKRVGECWHASASDDARYEIFIRADIANPIDVLGVLTKELIHTTLPADAGHGRLFKEAALKIGLLAAAQNSSSRAPVVAETRAVGDGAWPPASCETRYQL